MSTPLEAEIRERLASLAPTQLTLLDDSAKHVGHPGAAGGGGHYTLQIVAPAFSGMSRIARHRAVYDKLADLIPHRIHALAIEARSADEVDR